MVWHCFLRRGVVFVPSTDRTEAGFYMDVDPVEVVPLSDPDGVARALRRTVTRGNPIIPTPSRFAKIEPPVLKYSGVKSWSTFARSAILWGIGQRHGIFYIDAYKKRSDRGWEEDFERRIAFPPSATIEEVCERLVAILRNGG